MLQASDIDSMDIDSKDILDFHCSKPKGIIIIAHVSCVATTKSIEGDLRQHLFGNRSSVMERMPIQPGAMRAPLKVRHRLSITKVFDISLDEQSIGLSIWLSLQWKNNLVQWNHTKYGLKYLVFKPDKIWQPPIAIRESIEPVLLQATKTKGSAILFHDGTTSVDFSYKIKLGCTMSACLFPLEKHACSLTLNVISHNASEVFLSHESSAPGYNLGDPPHDLWKIKIGSPIPMMFNLLGYPFNWQTSMIVRSISLERKPSYYYLNIIVPLVLITVITLVAGILPRASGEKVSLLITCFLSQIVYLDVQMKIFPQTSNYVPLITIFTAGVLVVTALKIVLTSFASYLALEAEREHYKYSLFEKFYVALRRSRLRKKEKKHAKTVVRDIVVPFPGNNEGYKDEDADPTTNVDDESDKKLDSKGGVDLHKEYRETCEFMCHVTESMALVTSMIFFIVFPVVIAAATGISSFCMT